MALSKSAGIKKAQIPSLCHLCEDSPNIQWKCQDCDLLMCSKCKTKVHSKFKSADDHDVISLKDISSGSKLKKKTNLQNVPCKIHESQKVCLYCQTCEDIACLTCVTENHKKHDLVDLRKVFDDRVFKLQLLHDEMTHDLQIVVDEMKTIENEKSKRDNQDVTTENDILRQEKEIIELVHSEAVERIQKLKSSSIQQDNLMSSAKANYLRDQEAIKSKISTVEAALKGNDADTIINADKSLISSFVTRTRPARDDGSHYMKFFPGQIDKEQVSRIFGLLQHTKIEPEIKMTILLSHKTDFNMITNLYSCNNGNVYMFDEKYSRCMKMVQFKYNAISTLKVTEDKCVFDIAEIGKNEFVVSFVDNTALKRLKADGKFENFLDLSPLLPRALHLSRSGKLFVSVREKGSAFPLQPSSRRKILVMTTDGKITYEYNLDNQERRLFSLVSRITSGIGNDIYLTDWTSDVSEGRVVALRYPNQIVWSYSGQEDTIAEFSFRPIGIAVAEFRNIVVADKDNSVFHILNCDGILKRLINGNELGIIFPVSLSIDITGLIWIGCCNPEGTYARDAKLHVVKFSGF